MKTNLEIVRSNYEGPHCLFENLSPDVTWHEMEGFPYGGVYHGPEEIRQNVFQHIDADWEDFSAVPSEFISAGDRVITLGHYQGKCKATGKPLHAAFAHVYRLTDGRITEFRQYADSARLLQAMS